MSRSLALLVLPMLLGSCNRSPQQPRVSPALGGNLPSADWLAQAHRWIEEEQKQPRQTKGGLALHGGDLNARLDTNGIEVDYARGQGYWRFDLVAGPALPDVVASSALYLREGGVTEWYEARDNGIEQTFMVDEPPYGDLVISGRVDSVETARAEGNGWRFGDLVYRDLQVWDASGRPLHASIQWDEPTSTLSLLVKEEELRGADFPVTLDPLLTTWTWSSQGVGNYGWSVASAGDVNGDGFGDVLVGAPNASGDVSYEGKAFLFYGHLSGPSMSPDFTFEPADYNSAAFGNAVAGVGDIDNDGFGDFMVGAPQWGDGNTLWGKAWLYLGDGGPNGPLAPSTVQSPPSGPGEEGGGNSRFGWSIAGVGRINNDVFADVIIGAPYFNGTGSQFPSLPEDNCSSGCTNEGRAFLYRGQASGTLIPVPQNPTGWSSSQPADQTFAHFGGSVASAGDVNGDGFGDVIVGAGDWDSCLPPPATCLYANQGRAYLYLSLGAGLTGPFFGFPTRLNLPGNEADANFGQSVSGAGDVDADGFADVVVGAPAADTMCTPTPCAADEGKAYLFRGTAAGISTVHSLEAHPTNQPSASFGQAVAGVGDTNGDGYADVAVGAPLWDGSAPNVGRAFLYLGGPALASSPGWEESPAPAAESRFVLSVATAADVDQDGFGDAILGAPSEQEGQAYVYRGVATGLGPLSTTQDPTDQSNSYFGYGSSWTDVNGDGFADVVVGAPLWNGEAVDEGRAYLFRGGVTGLLQDPWTADPTNQAGAVFGNSIAGGDVTGDGFGDVVVSAPLAGCCGRAYLYKGSGSGLETSPVWTVDGVAGGNLGVATDGDFNGDGRRDIVLVQRPNVDVYLGIESGLPNSPDLVLTDPTGQLAYFGRKARGVGDVNGDGYDDLVVGAAYWDGEAVDEGRAYLYLGKGSGPPLELSSWIAHPTDQPEALFGGSEIGALGDVNGDGLGDVAVGAPFWDSPSYVDEGRVYVYHGTSAGLSDSPAWTNDPGDQDGAECSHTAGSGDVNGDGYADLVIGCTGWGNWEGKAYVYHGSITGLGPTHVWTADPTDTYLGYFGNTLAGAGDVNADGFGDQLIGGVGWSSSEGRTYLYLGGDGGIPGAARGLNQFCSNGITRIGVGTNACSGTVFLKGRVTQTGPVGGLLTLEVEVKPLGTPFDGAGTLSSIGTVGGATASVTVPGLTQGAKHWRARVVYPARTGHGRWVAFAGNTEVEADFRVP